MEDCHGLLARGVAVRRRSAPWFCATVASFAHRWVQVCRQSAHRTIEAILSGRAYSFSLPHLGHFSMLLISSSPSCTLGTGSQGTCILPLDT